MKTKFLYASLFVLFLSVNAFAQDSMPVTERYTAHNKGKFFAHWGGNRAYYTTSDLHFEGEGYNFTVENAQSHDLPKGWNIDYIKPGSLTSSQTNWKVGYFFHDKFNVSIGIDHMKYVMTQDQTAMINGNINLPSTEVGSQFNGSYNNVPVNLTDGKFLKFEHTNGLNYVFTEAAHYTDISSIFGITNTDIFQLNLTQGVGMGILVPRTDATVLGKPRHDEFHISGYGFSADAGLNFTFFKHFYMQTELKGGYINMTDVRTTYTGDHAQHHFWYGETIVSFGGIFRL
ncbi:hypothetical protein [Flavobacterium aestivum]|uniref:hypothetical protein n=1 Tax=Flavobacterium aestivum TaxID=3003257 RepID=UPI002285EDEA|nr:hypothetical protein [Flavobacterium aestivum]